MRISCLCVFILVGVPFFLIAQKGVEAGAVIQPQIYSQYYENVPDNRALKIPYSFAIGIDLGYNFSNFIGVRTGFLYNPQGERYNDLSQDPEVANDLLLNYIQVPLYLKINSNPEKTLSFILLGGPHIGFLNEATLAINNEDPTPVLGDYKRIIRGAAAGIGLQLNLEQGGNINFLWYNSASLENIQNGVSPSSRNVSTGIQLAYHYFITW